MVPDLLSHLVTWLPLPIGKEVQAIEKQRAKGKPEPMAAAAAAAEARLEGRVPEPLAWNLRKKLLQLEHPTTEALAPLLYRC